MKRLSHRQLNNALTGVVVLLAIYIILTPLLPMIISRPSADLAPYGGRLAQVMTTSSGTSTDNSPSPTPQTPRGNRIVIPSGRIDISLSIGSDTDTIKNGGALLKPLHTRSPVESGNSVIVAHRFTYGSPTGGFYHLPNVKPGDPLAIYWEGQELIYKVKEVKTVAPNDNFIEANTPSRALTIYTCTPLYVFDKRLVVIAEPME